MFSTVHVMYVLKSDHIHESDYSSDNVWQVCWFGLCNSRFCCMVRDITLFKQSRLHILIHNMKKKNFHTEYRHARTCLCGTSYLFSQIFLGESAAVLSFKWPPTCRSAAITWPWTTWPAVTSRSSADSWLTSWFDARTTRQPLIFTAKQQPVYSKKSFKFKLHALYSLYCTQITLYLHILSLFVQPSF